MIYASIVTGCILYSILVRCFLAMSTSLNEGKKEEECPDVGRKSFKRARACVFYSTTRTE
jgi:hypothetical protein